MNRSFSRVALGFVVAAAAVINGSAPVFAAAAASAPQYVQVWTGSDHVLVTWDSPASDGGDSNLTYTVRVAPLDSSSAITCVTKEHGCSVANLVSGTSYVVSAYASNSAGPGTSSATQQIWPGKTGPTPLALKATQNSNGTFSASWQQVTSVGDGNFSWYAVEAYSAPALGAGSYLGKCTNWPVAETSCTISSLKVGPKYYLQVSTVTTLGAGLPTSPRLEVFAGAGSSGDTSSATGSKPSAPTSVKAKAGNKIVRVSWQAPKSNGGSAITAYKAIAATSKGSIARTCAAKGTSTSCTITKLKNGTSYRISVVARNAIGTSSPSTKVTARPKAK
ncbi:MAG TPA: fibronectin type III domain-containing protein [Candidatus Nanopelagicaceae bacterium]|nr:fibronectin type III domain-containing protein [Candidatus Nanopelagicaceae bacterium]